MQISSFAQMPTRPIIFRWISHPKNVKVLDSLIHTSFYVALNPSDYNTAAIKKFNQNPASILNYKDSLRTELAIQKTATHFFNAEISVKSLFCPSLTKMS
jgi:hypothetical protein